MAVRGLYEKEVDLRFDAKFYEESAYNDVLKNIEDEEQNPPPPSATDDDDKPKLIIKPRD
ncbi:hypothetical protein CAOG_010247, partial [Capsaspora owczarzaki ATCC 30864]